MKLPDKINLRRKILLQSGTLMVAAMLTQGIACKLLAAGEMKKKLIVNGHRWVYASKFPPNWDCTPNLETVFADFSSAAADGMELMESALRCDDSMSRQYLKKTFG